MTHIRNKEWGSIRSPGFIVLILAWTLIGTLAYTRHLVLTDGMKGSAWSFLAEWMTCYYCWAILSPLLFRAENRFPLRKSTWKKNLAWLALLGIPTVLVAHALTTGLIALVRLALHQPLPPAAAWTSMLRCELLLQIALYCFTVGSSCLLRNMAELREGERRLSKLALEKSELEASLHFAELETLRMRLNPHFLFNSLQNISTLTREDPVVASKMLARLGDLLRVALRKETLAETTLAAEIDLAKAYLAIEKMRFADRLSVVIDMDQKIEEVLVPCFLLQPLVENAIKHGLRGKQQTGAIWIRCMRQVDRLSLTVSDNGVGLPKERLEGLEMGIGLGSTSERLARMYPGDHTLTIQALPEGGTEVRIVLPLRWNTTPFGREPNETAATAHR
jgi:sensor histidine kinase YesM